MENENTKKPNSTISVKSFIASTIIILCLWIGVYIATFFIPSGSFIRTVEGNIDIASYTNVTKDFPFWKFLLSPFLLFGSSDSSTIILIIVFLLAVSAAMNSLNKAGIMEYTVKKIAHKFGKKKYLCMALIILIFMLAGSFAGTFEEVVPFIPVMVTLSLSLGWDVFTGIAISLVACACGFAAGVMNPFTVGVAEKICGLPLFQLNGVIIRAISFVIIYVILFCYMMDYVKIIEKKKVKQEENETVFEYNPLLEKASKSFLIIIGAMVLSVVISSLIPALQSMSLIFITLGFLVCGIVCPIIAQEKIKTVGKNFLDGAISMSPAIIMILFASSIKFILAETQTLDTILKFFIDCTSGMSPIAVLLIMYLSVLVMNFFIPSGSAKAFLIIPLIAPLAVVNSIPLELCVLAFAFGDGFSNVLYPTNPVLLIGLNLVDEPYGDYIKRIGLFQLINLIITSAILVLAMASGLF